MMSSETSTKPTKRGAVAVEARLPADGSDSLQPWHLFVLGGLAAATAAVVLVRGTGPVNIILISIAIGTASLTGLAAFRTFAPLALRDLGERVEMVGGRTRMAMERDKMLVLRSIKELEFDRAMQKVSDADFQEMMSRLRARAIRLMTQLDGGAAAYAHVIERDLSARIGVQRPGARGLATVESPASSDVDEGRSTEKGEPSVSAPSGADLTCAQCGTANDADARFCKRCGGQIAVAL